MVGATERGDAESGARLASNHTLDNLQKKRLGKS